MSAPVPWPMQQCGRVQRCVRPVTALLCNHRPASAGMWVFGPGSRWGRPPSASVVALLNAMGPSESASDADEAHIGMHRARCAFPAVPAPAQGRQAGSPAAGSGGGAVQPDGYTGDDAQPDGNGEASPSAGGAVSHPST